MLTGEKLGDAIRAAIELKGVPQTQVARHFKVTPPSVQDWLKRGTIKKEKLPALWSYFSDVVGPGHWGLEDFPVDVEPGVDWVFPRIDQAKLLGLTGAAARGIENAILAAAGDLGLDLRVHHGPRA